LKVVVRRAPKISSEVSAYTSVKPNAVGLTSIELLTKAKKNTLSGVFL